MSQKANTVIAVVGIYIGKFRSARGVSMPGAHSRCGRCGCQRDELLS